MARDSPPPAAQGRPSQITVAFTLAVLSLALSTAHGTISMAPLGPEAVGFGVMASLCGSIIGGMVAGLFGGSRGMVGAPAAAISLSIGAVMARMVDAGILTAGPEGLAGGIAVLILLALLSGAMQAAIALLRIGRFATLLPFPVLAGAVNGVALLLISSQFAAGLGVDWTPAGISLANPLAPLLALTVMAVLLVPLRWPRAMPPILAAVLLGTGLYHALLPVGGVALLGSTLSALPAPADLPGAVWAGWLAIPEVLTPQALGILVPAAATISIFATIETLASGAVSEEVTQQAPRAPRDLLAMAVGTLVAALCAGMPVCGSLTATSIALRSGVKSKRAAVLRSGILLALFPLLAHAFLFFPTAVTAGIVLAVGIKLFNRDSLLLFRRTASARASHRRELGGSALIMVAVSGTAVFVNLVAAMMLGLLLSALVFTAAMMRDPVRRRYIQPSGRSRIRRADWAEQLLIARGKAIEVAEVEGVLFFGTVADLARQMDAALAEGTEYLILDLRRVARIDLSGTRRLLATCERHWRAGHAVLLAPLRPGLPVFDYLEDLGLGARLRHDRVFASLDAAIRYAEDDLIERHRGGNGLMPETPLAALGAAGIDAEVAVRLLPYLTAQSFAAGRHVIRAGEAADGLWFLVSGTADVVIPSGTGQAVPIRLATLTGGTLFGEMALLSGAPRSADLMARTAMDCLYLGTAVLERMRNSEPQLAYAVMLAIARQLERNLRMANLAVLGTEG